MSGWQPSPVTRQVAPPSSERTMPPTSIPAKRAPGVVGWGTMTITWGVWGGRG